MQVKRTILKVLLVLTMLAAVLTMCSALAHATTPVVKTVERLAYQREVAADKGTPFSLKSVRCKVTASAYVFICNFSGTNAGKRLCAATYVHYNPRNQSYGKPNKVNLWSQAWACGTRPPLAPPPYPGDGGPGA